VATSAVFSKGRSTSDRKAYEVTSTSDGDTRVALPNDFGSTDVVVLIEPARPGNVPADYLASNWRISEETSEDEIVLEKTPAPGSASKAVVFVPVKRDDQDQVPAVPARAVRARTAKAKK